MITIYKEDLENYVFKDKLSYEEIGRIYGCSGANIKKRAKKLGIKLPQKRKININETFNRGKVLSLKEKNICPNCGGYKYASSKLCKNCRNKEKYDVRNHELGYYIGYGNNRKKYLASKLNEIRKDARRFMENESQQNKVCKYCNNHEFDSILEVHHLRRITDFDEHEKVANINNDENLVWLCPNHHRMLENGLITL
jgi:ribosomal protein L32